MYHRLQFLFMYAAYAFDFKLRSNRKKIEKGGAEVFLECLSDALRLKRLLSSALQILFHIHFFKPWLPYFKIFTRKHLSFSLFFSLHYPQRPEIQESAPFSSSHGSPISGIWVLIKITVIPRGAYVTCIHCRLSMKIYMRETLHGAQRLWTHFVCVCFHLSRWRKPKLSHLELSGWWCHYTGQCRSSGISSQ